MASLCLSLFFHTLQYRISEAKPHHFIEKLFSVYSKMKPLLVSAVGAVFPLAIMYSLENSDWFDFYTKIFIGKKKHISWKNSYKIYWGKKFAHIFVFLFILLFPAKKTLYMIDLSYSIFKAVLIHSPGVYKSLYITYSGSLFEIILQYHRGNSCV